MSTPKPEPRKPKRHYRPPRLVRYGTIVELTRANLLKGGVGDGAGPKKGFFKSL
ncbi:MAG: lasso RiPP family leader peptide-containing protein [Myxococcota bacterium]